MKKIIAIVLSVLLVLSVGMLFVSADEAAQSADVYVTIVDENSKFALPYETVTVTDIDNDGTLTVNDALYAAHEQFYEGGAAAGYATETTKWGLSLMKLWGVANGGSYGYLVNNVFSWSLTDPVQENDYVAAFIYTDTEDFSDVYTYFDQQYIESDTGRADVDLTLYQTGYDAEGTPYTKEIAGAKLTQDGEDAMTTDNDGKVSFGIATAGDDEKTIIFSAKVDNLRIVPPICKVVLNKQEEASPDQSAPTTPTTPVINNGGEDDTDPTTTVTEAPSENKSTDDESTGDQSSGDSSSTPKTGDVSKMWLWILIGAFCLAGIIGAVVFYKKHYGSK